MVIMRARNALHGCGHTYKYENIFCAKPTHCFPILIRLLMYLVFGMCSVTYTNNQVYLTYV